ncbi:uncharacterized protein LOC111406669 [Olea europaea var. sylvestris]|uniref:uncharacterized protein LOC111406669 n=1 Tax=Olea europaea var. sylvestris TaxID=158386 RepID=UPI000C1D060B|nr:uncharacterized protein LOC111406669 [Olea europaea var. sylvestris]
MLVSTVTGTFSNFSMGYLLKEALKNLCGANQWSYAVFWKIGCQNPELLMWEEFFSEPVSNAHLPGISRIEEPGIGFDGYNACGFSAEVQAEDNLHLLINKMMTDNHVNVVGEGLVGRAAFTGNHQWILSENCTREGHPPQVLRELCQQFSAGMQTVAVIPVLPHGVIQLGSFFEMAENIRLVNDVKSLVILPGHEPGLLLSDNYAAKEFSSKTGVPVFLENSASGDLSGISNVINSTPSITDSWNYLENSAQTTQFVGDMSGSLARQIQDNLLSNGTAFNASSSGQSHIKLYDDLEAKFAMRMKSNSTLTNELVAKAELLSLHPETFLNQQASLHFPKSDQLSSSSSSTVDSGSLRWLENGILSNAGIQGHFGTPNVSSGMLTSVPRTNADMISSSHEDPGDHLTTNHMLLYNSGSRHFFTDDRSAMRELNVCNERMANKVIQAHGTPLSKHDEHKNSGELPHGFFLADRNHEFEGESQSFKNTEYEDACTGPQSGDDLFDMLGTEFKNKLFNSCWSSSKNKASDSNMGNLYSNNSPSVKSQDTASEVHSLNLGNSNSGILLVNGSEHLIDAVVSGVRSSAKQPSDNYVSCRTTLTNMSSYCGPNVELPYGQVPALDQIKEELFDVPEYLAKAEAMSSCSFLSGSSKDDSGNYSESSSIYGSQISSSIVKGNDIKENNCALTGYSKKPDEISKANRKRLKPGENPRPRPKDRQMIQDRVKELREIVPNGAKCSIDALLECTIKHMLFLQSVTKHADKLKQTGESKLQINGKGGGLLSKDNYEGGATWAYEVGSQSMVCPIIVEDLNQPHQMLVEMLCEERGLFLEIADIIRGLGLTILKGVMETGNDKIWAHFAVEADRDVSRMEIFVSLSLLYNQFGFHTFEIYNNYFVIIMDILETFVDEDRVIVNFDIASESGNESHRAFIRQQRVQKEKERRKRLRNNCSDYHKRRSDPTLSGKNDFIDRHLDESIMHQHPYASTLDQEMHNIISFELGETFKGLNIPSTAYVLPTFSYCKHCNARKFYRENNENTNVRTRDISIYGHSDDSPKVHYYYGCYDPLQYPLLFPYGESGWHEGIERCKSIYFQPQHMLAYDVILNTATSAIEIIEKENEVLNEAKKHTLVSCREYYSYKLQIRHFDMYVKIETARLDYFRNNQKQIRAELYQERVIAHIYVIEFQERELPHAHMLLIFNSENKITCVEEVDRIVSCEIPDKTKYPHLHSVIVRHNMHGYCGNLNSKNTCMEGNKEDINCILESLGKNINDYKIVPFNVDISENDKLRRMVEDETTNLNLEGGHVCGTGKTFLHKALLTAVRSQNSIALATASFGVSVSLLLGGRTTHSRFKIPLEIIGEVRCSVNKQSALGILLG